MHFGVHVFGTDPDGLIAVAQRAEALGYESIWRGEHWVVPRQFEGAYPYNKSGRLPFAIDTPILDNLTVFSFLAANTTRIKFSPGISILPLHNLYILARAITTVDLLSKGRMMLGMGVGWMKEEFDILGADFRNRGRISSEMIQALKALWTQREPSFKGDFVSVQDMYFEPKPTTKPHPPILVGGESEAALTRAAELGDGWYGHAGTLEFLQKQISFIRAKRAERGLTDPAYQITVRARPDITVEGVQQLQAIGVTRIILEAGRFDMLNPRDALPEFERFAERIVQHFPSPAA